MAARLATFAISMIAVPALLAQPKTFSGSSALATTARVVAFGPRPSGSPAIGKLRAFIRQKLTASGAEVSVDAFTGQTPDGPVAMENIIAKFPGKSGKAIAITGHYDTKKLASFVGANDGGSSAGLLLELAATLKGRPRQDDILLVFFDGEEAVREWTDTDSLYGSRHLAQRWTTDGTNRRLKALINVDMIGDKNLRVVYETGSAASVRNLIWDAAASLGYAGAFPRDAGAIVDDHVPFLNAGVRAVDLIDFKSQSTYWHTPQDTMDKLEARSFEIVGNVLMKVIGDMEQQK